MYCSKVTVCNFSRTGRKDSVMCLVGSLSPSDQLYPTKVLWCLEGTKMWLEGADKESWSPEGLFRLLEGMWCREKFQPSYVLNEVEPMALEGGLRYREPVWAMIHEVTLRHTSNSSWSASECAVWLQHLLGQVIKYRKFKKHIRHFKAKCLADNIFIDINFLKEDPNIQVGKQAGVLLSKVIDELIPKLEAYIEKR